MSNIEALKSLHTSLIDAEKGYQTAIADTQDLATKAVFEQFAALHARAHAHVHDLLSASGEHPDESGSFMALIHKTVISVRSAVAGLDRTSLPAFADGEEHIVGTYDKAIAATETSDSAFETLRGDRQSLVTAIAAMRAQAE